MRIALFFILSWFAGGVALGAQWGLMPLPSTIEVRPGQLNIGAEFAVAIDGAADSRVQHAVGRLNERMARLTGITFRAGLKPVLTVHVQNGGKPVQSIDEDESYRLIAGPGHAEITSPNPLGAMHGLETFYQLIASTDNGWAVPGVSIDDHPRFPWRGLHMDVSRHFMPPEVIRRNLDGMEAVKLNVFHWHLSDDQGFRVESKLYPKLHEQGSDGLYYTQDEIRGIVEYARDRGIRVVPEFDMPGHATSWLVGYPELAAAPGPFQIVRTWGVFDPVMDPANPAVYKFLDDFIGEMSALFPDLFFHIGGDEVNGKEWTANKTDIPPFMQAHGLKTPRDLQAYFNRQVQQILAKHGKHMEGWDEILNPALPKDIVIQSWRGAKFLTDATGQGYEGILSAGYYLDHIEPASKLYLVDPGLNNPRVLGGEVCMWAEYVSPLNVDTRIWPRTAAIAERFWSPPETKSVADMYRRLDIVDAQLDRIGATHNTSYRLLLEGLAGSSEIEPFKILADVTEPGTLGLRHRANPNYTQQTPLIRFVDAARPDSRVARQFGALVDRYLANRKDTAAHEEIRRWLTLWADNDSKLQPLLANRQIAQDAAPVSVLLSKIAAEALAGKAGPHLQTALKPIGEVNLAVAPVIARLLR